MAKKSVPHIDGSKELSKQLKDNAKISRDTGGSVDNLQRQVKNRSSQVETLKGVIDKLKKQNKQSGGETQHRSLASGFSAQLKAVNKEFSQTFDSQQKQMEHFFTVSDRDIREQAYQQSLGHLEGLNSYVQEAQRMYLEHAHELNEAQTKETLETIKSFKEQTHQFESEMQMGYKGLK